jgi:cell wall-associated NlpC family hydrolase
MSQVQSPAGVANDRAVLRAADTANRPSRMRILQGRAGKRLAALAIAGGLLLTPATGAIAAPFTPDGADGVAVAQDASMGQTIANFALQFEGYPYVWAGNTPAGFDCSGFTQYVILNTVGIDIGHGTAGQMNYGAWVDWGTWQPGDLIYFAGTYGDGISHTGVYIGDGMMIHAENEATGVRISSLYSDYYSAHYYGAIRIG